MTRDFVLGFRDGFISAHPEHKEEVLELFQLMEDEIEQGGSRYNEATIFIEACNALLEDGN